MDWFYEYLVKKHESKEHSLFPQDTNENFDYKEYIHFLLKQLGEHEQNESFIGKVETRKNDEKSKELRKIANNTCDTEFYNEALDKVLEMYTSSIAYGLDGKNLAMSYANRSAILFKVNRFQDCLEDIDRALKLNYPTRCTPKLMKLRADCYSKLAALSLNEATTWLDVSQPLNEMQQKILGKHWGTNPPNNQDYVLDPECILPQIKSPSKKYDCASDAIDIKYSEYFGRHIVATRDIEPGEVLVVEKPFSTFLEDDNLYTHCSNCMRYLWAGIPCRNCVNAVYCSEDCREKAWSKYHQLECPVLNVLLEFKALRSEMFSVRLFLEAIIEAGGLEELKERLQELEKLKETPEWQESNHWIQNQSLETLFSLRINEQDVPVEVLKDRVMYAVRAVLLLAVHTNIFGIQYNREKMNDKEIALALAENPDSKFVGILLVQLSLVALIKTHTFREECLEDGRCRGHVLMPFSSCFNHSCFANVQRQGKRHHMIIYALRPIQKDEQVFDTYGENVFKTTKSERQAKLQKNYYFTCNCEACTENWPVHSNMRNFETASKSTMSRWRVAYALSSFGPNVSMLSAFNLPEIYETQEMLKKLNSQIKIILNEVHMPCADVFYFIEQARSIYTFTGNISRLRYMQLYAK